MMPDVSPGDFAGADPRQLIVDWWNQLRINDDVGAADRGTLDVLEQQVTECLHGNPPNVDQACSLTAIANLMVAGHDNL